MSPSNPFIFNTGDLSILVTYKGGRIVGSVLSHAMVLASPVWQKFVFPPFQALAATTSNVVVKKPKIDDIPRADQLDFSEDDGEALLILLCIVHLQFRHVPLTVLSFDLLLNLAVLCDKYDAVKIVEPWIYKWCSEGPKEWGNTGHEQWLFIAWVFGRKDIFEVLANHMVRYIKLDEKQEYIVSSQDSQKEFNPEGIIQSILDTRNTAITSLLDAPFKVIEILVGKYTVLCNFDKNEAPNERSQACGSYLHDLIIRGYWPVKAAEDINMSFKELYIALALRKTITPACCYKCNKCKTIRTKINRLFHGILTSIPSPLLDIHRRHFAKRALDLAGSRGNAE